MMILGRPGDRVAPSRVRVPEGASQTSRSADRPRQARERRAKGERKERAITHRATAYLLRSICIHNLDPESREKCGNDYVYILNGVDITPKSDEIGIWRLLAAPPTMANILHHMQVCTTKHDGMYRFCIEKMLVF